MHIRVYRKPKVIYVFAFVLILLVSAGFLHARGRSVKTLKDHLAPPKDTPEKALKCVVDGKKIFNASNPKKKRYRKNLRKALKKFKKAARHAPKWVAPHYHSAKCCRSLRDYKVARDHMKKVVELKKDFIDAWLELSDLNVLAVDYDRAIDVCTEALKIEPKKGELYARRGKVSLRIGLFEDAGKDFARALELGGLKDEGDIFHRLSLLKQTMWQKEWGKKFVKETDNYFVETSISQEYADQWVEKCELIYKAYTKIFPKTPKCRGKFRVRFHKSKKDYVSDTGSEGSLGSMLITTKMVILWNQPDKVHMQEILFHEAFHQYLTRFIDNAPYWFDEGHAQFYQAFLYIPKKRQMLFRPDGLCLNNFKIMSKQNELASLEKLVMMTGEEFCSKARAGHNYVQAWAFVYFCWMGKGGKYRKYMLKYFKAVRSGLGLKESFESVFRGVNWKRWEDEYKTFINGLDQKKASPIKTVK